VVTIDFFNRPAARDKNKKFAIAAQTRTIGPMLIDLHVHTSLSACGRMTIGDILDHIKARGLDGVCITDHDAMDIRHFLSEGVQESGVCVIFGTEYSTSQGDFLIFGPFEDLPAHLSAHRLLQTVQDRGGVAVAAHPFRKGRCADEALIREGLCGAVECLNGRNAPQENSAATRWRQRYALAGCGGSDAHTLDELGTFATRFLVPVRTRAELIRALKNGMCQPEIPLSGNALISKELPTCANLS
jgi:predicted metal-dependent phosphoesterase TrpH